uniref:Nuclear pore complex protein Nup85 n=1 Tax=Angiostrongylus cantonensis TaxID=6313 RepID=A0A0K0CXJ7_ANGCA
MELDREEGEVKWFKFVHNSQYEELERLCWAVEDEKVFDPGLIKEILVGNPYHLNSLMLLANIFHMQEDVTESCDVIEDPLAVLLLIDTIAIKAKQYSWFKDFYQCWKEWKNLNVLPNFCYSAALAQFLDAKTDEDFDVADQMLTQAICAFPGVISMLLDKLQIEPDPLVESHRHLGTFARNKESDGVKLVFKIYVNEAAELWKTPETLSWLEHVTRSCAERQHCTNEMKIWREKRKRLFVGVPLNIRRLAVLLGLEPSSSTVTDPVPPLNGRARHGEHLTDALQRLSNQVQQALFPPRTSGADETPQDPRP